MESSDRSWLCAALFAMVATWWPAAAAVEPVRREEGFRCYTYDRINGLVPVMTNAKSFLRITTQDD